MTPAVCVWCLCREDDPIHAFGPSGHAFVGPRIDVTPRELARRVAEELRRIATESLGANARVADALDLLP